MDENNGKVLRDIDGEIVGFWTKPLESGSISCSNIEGLTCGDPDPYTCTDGEAHPDNGIPSGAIKFSEDMTINYDPNDIKIEKERFYINGKELDCDKAWEWIQEAIYEKAEREKLVKKCSLCKRADGNGEKRYYCMSHGDFVGDNECCSRFQPEEDE